MLPLLRLLSLLSVLLCLCNGACHEYEALHFRVDHVRDGDTVSVWLSSLLPPPLNAAPVGLRVHGVDAPESGARARCTAERQRAAAATAFVVDALRAFPPTVLAICGWDKYGGRPRFFLRTNEKKTIRRVLGDLRLQNDRWLSEWLVAAGHVVPYSGRGDRHDWCVPA